MSSLLTAPRSCGPAARTVRPSWPATTRASRSLTKRKMRGGTAQAALADLLPACLNMLLVDSAAAGAGLAAAAAEAGGWLDASPAAATAAAAGADTFAPQLRPEIAIAAAAAATPPLIFWGRIFLANQRRLAELERQREEEERRKEAQKVGARGVDGGSVGCGAGCGAGSSRQAGAMQTPAKSIFGCAVGCGRSRGIPAASAGKPIRMLPAVPTGLLAASTPMHAPALHCGCAGPDAQALWGQVTARLLPEELDRSAATGVPFASEGGARRLRERPHVRTLAAAAI